MLSVEPLPSQNQPSAPAVPGEELGATQPLFESELLPDSTKITMLLEAAPDIRDVERHLREITLLTSRQVQGSGSLAGTPPPPSLSETGLIDRRAATARSEFAIWSEGCTGEIEGIGESSQGSIGSSWEVYRIGASGARGL